MPYPIKTLKTKELYKSHVWAFISANGRRPTTLRPPIGANPSTRGFAGGRNVAEAERAICERSEAWRAHRG
jgi:hypothetical protein